MTATAPFFAKKMTYFRVLVLKLFSCDASYECCFLINNGTKTKAEQSLLGNSTAVTTVNAAYGHTHTIHNNYAISIRKGT